MCEVTGKHMENNKPHHKTLITAAEAANRFSVPLSPIYTWHRLGMIDGVKLSGKSLRIFTESLRAFLESRNKKV